MLPYIICENDTHPYLFVLSVSKIAQNYWHSLHLNWKEILISNFSPRSSSLTPVSCVARTGPNRYKMQNTQTILYSLSQICWPPHVSAEEAQAYKSRNQKNCSISSSFCFIPSMRPTHLHKYRAFSLAPAARTTRIKIDSLLHTEINHPSACVTSRLTLIHRKKNIILLHTEYKIVVRLQWLLSVNVSFPWFCSIFS